VRIVHVTDTINENIGGPPFAITQLAVATAQTGRAGAEILAFDLPGFGQPLPTSPQVPVALFQPFRPYLWGFSRPYAKRLRQAAQDPEVIFHLHAIWRVPTVTASRLARSRHLPCVISPRGTLDPWSLAHRGARKKMVWRLLVQPVLRRANVLCATSRQEAENIARLVPNVPIALIPNGVHLPPRTSAGPTRSSRTALYLSRIAPNKGLQNLLQAWARVKPREWSLKVAGPDENGHLALCQRAVQELGLEKSVSFLGPVHGRKKWETFGNADLFILPTLGENFGQVVLEALACGLPVITTRRAPWEELVPRRCGWWIEAGVEPLVQALGEALEQEAELPRMGARGRALVEEKYTWPRIALEMISVYQWVAGSGPRPACLLS